MTQFPGQISGRGLYGTQMVTWSLAPFYLKVFFVVKKLSIYVFKETSA